MLPRHLSPRAGEPPWAGRETGEAPKSGSVTAEAGKLPTLKVRPFWPFQVVVSGLWKEELVKKMGSGRVAAGLRPCSAHQAMCLEATSAWRKGSLFLSNTNRALWARQGSSREGRTALELRARWRGEKKTRKPEIQGDGEKLRDQEAGRVPPPGMLRRHNVVTCPQ